MKPPTNRLADSLSPYLLQHAHNPVDWYPWGEEALARAEELDRPIFLSIGYSACHWCHVMEKESFENEQVAKVLNESFVPIKVDREERPDLDELYMTAVQAMNGSGGWPMSVWLTPNLEPFFGGTYFPPEPRGGMPGFLGLLRRIASLWEMESGSIRNDASRLTEKLRAVTRLVPGEALPKSAVYSRALEHLRGEFDARFGGFGRAPKFPPHIALEFLAKSGTKEDLHMVTSTLDAMAAGGMFDHLGGGFARYSVDDKWLVPHFEKMLYDNALLASAYLRGFEVTGEKRFQEVARETLDFMLRQMADPAGGFQSAIDADSEGEEGRFYVFTKAEIRDILGGEADNFCEAFGVSEHGNFEGGRSVLNRLTSWKIDISTLDAAKLKVLDARNRRERPLTDDKVLASWNGLALSAFSKGYRVLKDPVYLEAAVSCAEFIEHNLWNGVELLRVWRRGRAHTFGFLEDYASVALGLHDLFEAGADPKWLSFSGELAQILLDRFEDPQEGGFFTTQRTSKAVLFRIKSSYDGAVPSGLALTLGALERIGLALCESAFEQSVKRALVWLAPSLERTPFAYLAVINACDCSKHFI